MNFRGSKSLLSKSWLLAPTLLAALTFSYARVAADEVEVPASGDGVALTNEPVATEPTETTEPASVMAEHPAESSETPVESAPVVEEVVPSAEETTTSSDTESVPERTEPSLPSSGTYTVEGRAGVKSEPKVTNPSQAVYKDGKVVNYDSLVEEDGRLWISYTDDKGNRSYIAVEELEGAQKDERSASQGNYDVINRVIYLDAGHGGSDPGAVYGVTEKELNMAIQKELQARLEALGYTVVLLRTDDTYVGLLERSRRANQTNSDLFISIHFNASPNSNTQGIETYYYGYDANYQPKINNYHLDADRMERSAFLAKAIQNGTVATTQAVNRGVFQETLSVLRETVSPSVLLELGYMSNPTERAKITQVAYQKKLVDGIVRGIEAYYQEYDKKASVQPKTDTVTGASNPEGNTASSSTSSQGTLPSTGVYHFEATHGVKHEAKLSARNLDYYYKGESVRYDRTLIADGYEWISYIHSGGGRSYVAIKPVVSTSNTSSATPSSSSTASSTSTSSSSSSSQGTLPSTGVYHFEATHGVKHEAKLSARNLDYYYKGESVRYDRTLIADDYEWISYIHSGGGRSYVAIKPVVATSTPAQSATTEENQPSPTPSAEVTSPAETVTVTKFANAKAEVVNYSETSPTFTVKVTGQEDTETINQVRVAVWSQDKGQDDLKWYSPTITNNQASVQVDIKDHSNTSDKYVVHVYTTYANGQTIGTDLGSYQITKPAYIEYNTTYGGKIFKVLGNYTPDNNILSGLITAMRDIERQGYSLGFKITDAKTGEGIAYNADSKFYSASTIKAPYVISLAANRPATINSQRQTMRNIAEWSSNDGYTNLRNAQGASPIYDWAEKSGVSRSSVERYYPYLTVNELHALWETSYDYFTSSSNGQQVASLFENPNLSPIKATVGTTNKTQSKAGWIAGWGYHAANDAGIVYTNQGDYIITIMSNADAKLGLLNPVVRALDAAYKALPNSGSGPTTAGQSTAVTTSAVTLPATGVYHFEATHGVKHEAKLSARNLDYYYKGESVRYDRTLIADDYEWISYINRGGSRSYVAIQPVKKSESTPATAPSTPSTPAASPTSTAPSATTDSLPSTGVYNFTATHGVKHEAKLSARNLDYYYKGESVRYDRTLIADNYEWISYINRAGSRSYVAIQPVATASAPSTSPSSSATSSTSAPSSSASNSASSQGSLPSTGVYHFEATHGVKHEAKLSARNLDYYYKGESVRYDRTLIADNYEWISYINRAGSRSYVAIQPVATASAPSTSPSSSATSSTSAPSSSASNSTSSQGSLPSTGVYHFEGTHGVKHEAKLSARNLDYYYKGESVRYDRTLIADGYEWISYINRAGSRSYVAIQPVATASA